MQRGLQYLGLCVCLSVKSHLTYGASVRPENAVTYSTGNEGQKICGIFSENAPLLRSSQVVIVFHTFRWPCFFIAKVVRIHIIIWYSQLCLQNHRGIPSLPQVYKARILMEGQASSRCAQGTNEEFALQVLRACSNRLTQHMQLLCAKGLHFSAFHLSFVLGSELWEDDLAYVWY